ncbi:hypothetical protein WDU94_012921 [Cyamophila willieti]
MPDKTSKVIATIKEKINQLRNEELKQGFLNVDYFWTTQYTGLILVATCKDVWRIFVDNEENNFIYLVITESDCPRLPAAEAITLPLGPAGSEISQILLDLRTSKTFNWKTVNLIHDDTIDQDLIGGFIGSLTKEMPTKTSLAASDVAVFNFKSTNAEWEKSQISPYVQTLEGEQDASPIANPTWDKMIDFVTQKRVFLAAAAFTHTYKHESVINYTAAISVEPYVFLVAKPQELSKALLFTAPFTPTTWLCIGISVVITIPLLYGLHMISPYYEHFKIREQSGFHKFSNCVWYTYGALLQQGGGKLPEADSGRLMIGTWWLFVLVIVTTYCGNLVAFLTFPMIDTPVTNVNELLENQWRLSWGISEYSTLHTTLQVRV